jgi:hypothetical protein
LQWPPRNDWTRKTQRAGSSCVSTKSRKISSDRSRRSEIGYAQENFFINNYSKGLYHHVTFEEQLDIIKWVESVEKKLQVESHKQFEDFEKSISDINELGVSKIYNVQESGPLEGQSSVVPGLTAEMSLRDTSKEMSQIDSIKITQVDEKNLKELFGDIKSVLSNFYKCNEESYKLWAELNNQTMDKIIKYFSGNSEQSSKQYAMFSLTVEDMLASSPSLMAQNSSLSSLLTGVRPQDTLRRLFDYDWDMLRTKITGENTKLIARNSKEDQENVEAFSRVNKESFENLSKTAANIKKLKEYFSTTKQKLSDIQKEFSQRMNDVKLMITTFKKNVESCDDYEMQLKLEYEIRLEINRLYKLKHSHESEFAGLEKRLEELESFNTSTELVHSLLNCQVIQFFEKCEDNMLMQVRDSSLVRLASILSSDLTQWKVEQGEAACHQIEQFYQIKLESPITDDCFKEFLIKNLLSGRRLFT